MGSLELIVSALLGGLILNVMPCVLPVLSIKVAGLSGKAGHEAASATRASLATTAGIVVSFWLLAGLVIALKAAGETVGWGIQFQSPVFIVFLTVVMVLFALNLWGVFEIRVPGALMQLGLLSFHWTI